MKSRVLKSELLQKHKSRFGRIIVLSGARQTGKTTLARKNWPDYEYLSIEDPILRSDLKKLTAKQWQKQFPLAILDEVQKEPVLIESIKSVYDQNEKPRYILLGSSQLLLLQKVKESLAGRCHIFEVLPLTLPELRTTRWESKVNLSLFQQMIIKRSVPDFPSVFRLQKEYTEMIQCYEHYLQFGGYPAISEYAMSGKEKREWLKNYIRTYLERDIRDLVEIRNLEPFIKIQKITALLTGQTTNYSQLAKEANVSTNSAQRFINYMDLSYQTIYIQPWHSNQLKRLTKSPKLHYLDPGIQRTIVGKEGELNGNEFESAIVAEIFKQLRYSDQSVNLYHLRTFDGREVDLLLETEEGFYAIEVKMTEHAGKSDIRHLKGVEQFLDKPLIHSFVLSNDVNTIHFDNNITAVHAAMFLG